MMTLWPRMMKRKTAAAYVDMTESAFEAEVAYGRLPAPVMLGKREHWDKLAIDAALSRLTGNDDKPDWEKEWERKFA